MKTFLRILLMAVIFACVFAGKPGKKHAGNEKAFPLNESAGNLSGTVYVPLQKNNTYTVTTVSSSVANLRSILGIGRNIWTDENGVIHVTFLSGTTGTYKLFYAQSSDNGATFDLDGPLGEYFTGDDRYPGIFVNTNGVYIAYSENNVPGAGQRAPMMLFNDEPFTNAWTGYNTVVWNGPVLGYLISNAGGSPARAYGTYYEAIKCPYVGETAVNVWTSLGFIGDTLNEKGSAPGIVASGDYVLVSYGQLMEEGDLDTLIWNNFAGNSGQDWMMFAESADGGLTFTEPAMLFGPNYTDYPEQLIDTGAGPEVSVRLAGPTGWNNEHNPIIVNGMVYVISNVETLDPNGGQYSGISAVVVSQKPVGAGGTWTHSVVSTPFDVATGEGNYWYAGIGSVHGHPDLMYVMAVDRGPDPDHIVFFTGINGGLTWFITQDYSGADLGFAEPAAGTIFACVSPYAVFQDHNYIFADVTFLVDNAGAIVNTTQYHVRLNIIYPADIHEKDPLANSLRLEQNYPNPFNPNTTISYDITRTNNVTLKIYNMLGQEVKTLVKARQSAGNYKVQWDGKDNAGKAVASGIYLYRLVAGDQVRTKKMIFMK